MTNILIIEDNVPLGQLYTRFLAYMGADVKQATSCRQALDHLKNESTPDVVILDMTLPDGTGLSIAQYLQASKQFDGTHVIAVSSDDGYARDVRNYGIQHFFCKPVALPILVNRIKELLGEPDFIQ